MLKAQIDMLLGSYKANTLRRRHICAEMKRVRREIRLVEETAAEVTAVKLTGMPGGGGVVDRTGDIAADLSDGTLPAAQALRRVLERLAAEKKRVEGDIEYVEIWFEALDERERHVIMSQVIDKRSWQSVVESYNREFGIYVCEETLRRIKISGLNKIYAIAA
ncbi:MAG: hypothetical protein Q4D04_14860 [Clostridia bacterium]|nr:hypothetical protein [Clostridia bacterium]